MSFCDQNLRAIQMAIREVDLTKRIETQNGWLLPCAHESRTECGRLEYHERRKLSLVDLHSSGFKTGQSQSEQPSGMTVDGMIISVTESAPKGVRTPVLEGP